MTSFFTPLVYASTIFAFGHTGSPADGAPAIHGVAPSAGGSGEIMRWPEEASLVPPDVAPGDDFGRSVAVGPDRIVVGAPLAQIEEDPAQGAGYVYVRSPESLWEQEGKLVASDGGPNEWFAWSVAVDPEQVIVGARLASAPELHRGAVYIFNRSGSVWAESQKLTASDGAKQDRFGSAASIAAERLLVGASHADIDGNDAQGAVYVFERLGGEWSETQKLSAEDGGAADLFGRALAASGDTAVVGGEGANGPGGPNQGAAWVFHEEAGVWSLEQKLTASDGQDPDSFGHAVSVSGDVAIVGAHQATVVGQPRQGKAYVFRREGTVWTEEQILVASDGSSEDNFGIGVAIEGNTALVGAEFDFPGNPEQGVVYEFRYQDGVWTEIGKWPGSEGHLFDNFGQAIALDRQRAVVGASSTVPGGRAYAYTRPPLFADGFESGDTSAWSVTVP